MASLTPTITQLDNGLTVATRTMRETEAVSLSLWVKVGSRWEEATQNGIAHFLEHMAFKGTKTRTARDIAESFDAIGGMFNAATGREYTTYYAKVLKEHFTTAADIIADITLNSIFDAQELERERGVILQEIAMTNDTPDDLIFEHYQHTAFKDQPLGRSILGPPEHIHRFKHEDFIDYTTRYYTASNMVFSVAGNIEHEAVLAFAQRAFGDLNSGHKATPLPATYQGGVTTTARDLEQVHLTLGWKGLSYHDENIYTLQILANILGGGMSARLFQEVREKRGLAYHISSFTSNYADTGLFTTYAGCAPDKVSELLPVLIDELHKACHHISEEELIRSQTQIRAGLLMGYESSGFCADDLGKQLCCYGEVLSFDTLMSKLESITTDALQVTLRDILRHSDPCFCALGDVSQIPDIETLVAPLKAAA